MILISQKKKMEYWINGMFSETNLSWACEMKYIVGLNIVTSATAGTLPHESLYHCIVVSLNLSIFNGNKIFRHI